MNELTEKMLKAMFEAGEGNTGGEICYSATMALVMLIGSLSLKGKEEMALAAASTLLAEFAAIAKAARECGEEMPKAYGPEIKTH